MHRRSVAAFSWLIVAVLPFAAWGASQAQQEFQAVLDCKTDWVRGQKLFDTCAACHSSNGAGASDGTVPAIAAQHFRVIVRELVDFRHDRRWDERMAHFTNDHHLNGVQDIADVAAFVSQLPVPPPSHRSDVHEKRGAEIYARLCGSCHGANAEGDNLKGYPRLAGQHYEYLLDQLRNAVGDRRPEFEPKHIRLLKSVQRSELDAVADYLSSLGPSGAH